MVYLRPVIVSTKLLPQRTFHTESFTLSLKVNFREGPSSWSIIGFTEHSLCAVEAILGLIQIEAGLSILSRME